MSSGNDCSEFAVCKFGNGAFIGRCYVHALRGFAVNAVSDFLERSQVAFDGLLDNSSRSNGKFLAPLRVTFLHSVDSNQQRIANEFVPLVA
jgi:hypothetical protein